MTMPRPSSEDAPKPAAKSGRIPPPGTVPKLPQSIFIFEKRGDRRKVFKKTGDSRRV